MQNRAKRTLSILLVMALIISMSLFSGIGAVAFGEGAEEPMELILVQDNSEKANKDHPILQELEKTYNVNFTIEPYLDNEALKLRIASNDVPDYFWNATFAEFRSYIDQEIIAEVPMDMLIENAPLLYEWFNEKLGVEGWKYFESDGKNYSAPSPWTLALNCNVVGYRSDIFESCGYDEFPSDIDGLYTALKAINEQMGIAPMTGTSDSSVSSFSYIYGAYGVYLTYYVDDNDTVVFGAIEESARQAVTTLNQWYNEGLIDPEFMINKDDNIKDKWSNDRAAVFQACWWDFLPEDAFFGAAYYNIIKDDENKSNGIAYPPYGPDGNRGLTEGNVFSHAGILFSKEMEDQPEKMAKYLEVFNGSFDQEVMDMLSLGYENVTYTYDSETGVNWISPYDDKDARNDYGIGIYSLPGCINDYDLQAKYMTQPQYLELRQDAESKGIGMSDKFKPYNRPAYNAKSEVLDKIYKNAHIDFITGARPLSEWDDFVAEWLSTGGAEVLAETQAIHDSTK